MSQPDLPPRVNLEPVRPPQEILAGGRKDILPVNARLSNPEAYKYFSIAHNPDKRADMERLRSLILEGTESDGVFREVIAGHQVVRVQNLFANDAWGIHFRTPDGSIIDADPNTDSGIYAPTGDRIQPDRVYTLNETFFILDEEGNISGFFTTYPKDATFLNSINATNQIANPEDSIATTIGDGSTTDQVLLSELLGLSEEDQWLVLAPSTSMYPKAAVDRVIQATHNLHTLTVLKEYLNTITQITTTNFNRLLATERVNNGRFISVDISFTRTSDQDNPNIAGSPGAAVSRENSVAMAALMGVISFKGTGFEGNAPMVLSVIQTPEYRRTEMVSGSSGSFARADVHGQEYKFMVLGVITGAMKVLLEAEPESDNYITLMNFLEAGVAGELGGDVVPLFTEIKNAAMAGNLSRDEELRNTFYTQLYALYRSGRLAFHNLGSMQIYEPGKNTIDEFMEIINNHLRNIEMQAHTDIIRSRLTSLDPRSNQSNGAVV